MKLLWITSWTTNLVGTYSCLSSYDWRANVCRKTWLAKHQWPIVSIWSLSHSSATIRSQLPSPIGMFLISLPEQAPKMQGWGFTLFSKAHTVGLFSSESMSKHLMWSFCNHLHCLTFNLSFFLLLVFLCMSINVHVCVCVFMYVYL